jgi:sRNA-binding protein
MSSEYWIERDHGAKESRQQLGVLRDKWPLAFPVKDEEVRPLTVGAGREIAAAMGWSLPYTLGVLGRWKMAPVYCRAVLSNDQRIALDGSPAEAVDAKAKDLATKQLERLALKAAKAKKAPQAAARVAVTPKPAPPPAPPQETAEQLRNRIRASLLRRSA